MTNKVDTVIDNDVWIEQNVTVLPCVKIGDGAIIGANSLVSKDVPPYCIVVGNPIKNIRKRFDDETIEFLLQLQWWNWSDEKIFANIELLCDGDITKIKNIK